MLQSLFVKPCNKCKGSGEADSLPQKKEVCSECKGSKYEVDYDYLRLIEQKVWGRLSTEKIISLVREIDEGIQSIESLPTYPKNFLSKLYHIRGQFFQFLAESAAHNKDGYFYEALRSLRISHELDENAREDD